MHNFHFVDFQGALRKSDALYIPWHSQTHLSFIIKWLHDVFTYTIHKFYIFQLNL
jgi:hypothetical protein